MKLLGWVVKLLSTLRRGAAEQHRIVVALRIQLKLAVNFACSSAVIAHAFITRPKDLWRHEHHPHRETGLSARESPEQISALYFTRNRQIRTEQNYFFPHHTAGDGHRDAAPSDIEELHRLLPELAHASADNLV